LPLEQKAHTSPFPGFAELLLPLLQAVADGKAHSIDEVAPAVAEQLQLTADKIATPGPNPRHTMLEYRLRWARTMAHKAELVTLPGELLLQITPEGRAVLASEPKELNEGMLASMSPAFAQWLIDMGDMNLAPTLRGEQQAIWVIRAGEGGSQAASFLKIGIVSMGFGEHHDLTGRDRDTIFSELKQSNPDLTRRALAQNANALFRFANVLQAGDVVLTPEPGSKSFLLGEIIGPYKYTGVPVIADHTATRVVRWFARIPRDDLSHGARNTLGSIMTFFQPGYQQELRALAAKYWGDQTPLPLSAATVKTVSKSVVERVSLPADAAPPAPYTGESFATDKSALLYLLGQIENRQLALPDFQRTFVWEASATRELIVSIMQAFPAGALLFLRNDTQSLVPRSIEGAPELAADAAPPFLILDGQQRLSSLYHAFYGAGRHSFFLDIGALMRSAVINEAVKVLPPRMVDPLKSIEAQAEMLMMPLARVRDASDWIDEVLDAREHVSEDKKRLRTLLRGVDKAYVEPIRQYQFPVTTLPASTPLDAVCTIFETLNRTGVPLTIFELICARAFADGESLLRKWREACEARPIFVDFSIDPYYILQAIALRRGPSCNRTAVLALPAAAISAEWDAATADFAAALRMLREDCGVMVSKWLPYRPMLIPLAMAWRSVETATGPAVARLRARCQRWFWCSVFTGEYESSSISLAERDAPALKEWLDGGDEPEVVRDFEFTPQRWRSITPRQEGAYKATIALLLRAGPRDFHTGVRLSPEVIKEHGVDDHHIFPRGYFHDEKLEYPVDTVLNHTLLDRVTNIRIGKRAPSKYLGDIKAELGDRLDLVLESHGLPIGQDSPLWRDDFVEMCDFRLELLTELLTDVTG
jgi:hypothetical protein